MKARRWSDTAAFRADPAAVQAARPSRRQTVALLVVLTLIAGTVVAASYLVRPEKARAFDLIHGSVFLEDTYAPVGIDLATGKPTVRLVDAVKQVGATKNDQLSVVPLDGATLLLNNGVANTNSGEFNEVDDTGFVVKPDGSGVPLSRRTDRPIAVGFADTGANNPSGSAYIERTGSAGTDVFLVNETTVQNAANQQSQVKPRASISFSEAGADRPGGGASANGGLWLLVKSGGKYLVRELAVPAGSNNGVELDKTDHGRVDTTAAIGVARRAGSNPTDVVGVAEPGQVTLYRPGAQPVRINTGALRGVDDILPATNQDDQLTYLVHASDGWSVVSVDSDGQHPQHATLPGVPGSDALAQPVYSGGALYTLDKNSGTIYAVQLRDATARVTPIATYPKQTGEAASLDDAYLIGRGPRVIVNSPGHSEALVLFTDGSHTPLTVRKSSAVEINAAATATTFTQDKVDQTNQRTKPKGSGGSVPKSQPISTRVDCSTVNQKPHIPVITGATPGSRSVALSWSYPLLDQQDCAPSTYVVTVKVLSNDAPKPDGSVTVQGQQGVNISGLYPSTRYQLTVTAYLNKLDTSSQPLTVTTGPEGPAAPTGVQASADSAGNWTVRWNGCGDVAHGCVPAVSWRVIPSFCDGVGLSGTPAPLNVPADPSTKAQAPALYKGSDDLLGRGLQFQVQGAGAQGQAGTPSANSACVYSWTAPNVAAMALHASNPPNTTLGGTSSTNVTLNLGADPTRNVGGYGAKVTLTLSGDGTTQSKSFTFNGNQSVLGANFGGVRSGAVYTASATVAPAHGGGSATVPPVQVSTRANWPNTSMSAHCEPSGLLTCTLSINVHGISSADARGERFTFEGDLTCASAGQHIERAGIDPAAGPITVTGIDQGGGFYNTCKLSGTLRESSNQSPLVFGGSVDTLPSISVDLGTPKVLGATEGDFAVGWEGNTAVVDVRYTGGNAANLSALTKSWSISIVPPGAGACQTTSAQPPTSLGVDKACIQAHGADDGWQVTIQYTDQIGGGQHNFSRPLSNPPSYVVPCTPTGFSAAWGQTPSEPITVTYGGSAKSISTCNNWAYILEDSSETQVCPGATASGAPTQPITISYADCGTPPAAGWQVRVSWTDENGGAAHADVPITGAVPTP
ncbi:MAG TPA: fibronectin type III domain-containing protein [Jatrophihabitans sp.]|nr:fibronectin type III domain-containing protein [Jatrophihabitans sp.]